MANLFPGFKKKPIIASALALALASSLVQADHHRYDKSFKHKSLKHSSTFPMFLNHHFHKKHDKSFKRIATFPVFLNSSIDNETVAEIVAVSKNGNTLVYTDGKMDAIGFVDIKNPHDPKAKGIISVGGEPTSIAVKGRYALAAVNTSVDYVAVSGKLVVIDIKSKKVIREIELGGQPDSIAVSPNGRYAAIVLENERNEDFNDGALPQYPAGGLVIVDLKGKPKRWSTRIVSLTGLDGMLYPSDPEPEYVDINKRNIAVVTLQENNHIVLVDLKKGKITNHFSAGTQDLEQVDVEKDKLINMDSRLTSVPREPDGVNWINNQYFATADEGDLDGGSRGYTIYDKSGHIQYESANTVEHTIVAHGHYPEKRAGKKGNEPENVEVGKFNGDKYLFVGSERASVTLVYNVNKTSKPILKQVLPTSVKPEGLLAIPKRKLFIAAGEEDSRDDKIRSALSIYQYTKHDAEYPKVISSKRDDGTPIPWGALSGLAADPEDGDTMYTVHDSFYDQARIFEMNVYNTPARIVREIQLIDSEDKLKAIDAAMVNSDDTVNLDQEGIAIRKSGGFWIASEGKGTIGDANKPFETKDLLLGVQGNGVIDQVIELPDSTNARQIRFGFEGVASTGTDDNEVLFVAFQREWTDDQTGFVRIGRYEVANDNWSFYYYPLETPLSDFGGWVGLSEITALDDENFLVIERDNQGNADAAIKRIYQFSIENLTAKADPEFGTTPDFPVVEKSLVRDLMSDLAKTNGLTLEKIEGLAVTEDDELFIVNDNDGVDDSNGETQLIKIGIDL